MRVLVPVMAAFVILLGHAPARAQSGQRSGPYTSVTAECLLQVSRQLEVPSQIILGFLKTEGGRLGSESLNKNGSFDLGPMQVNSRVWVPRVARVYFSGDEHAAWAALRDNGCFNIAIGTLIYRGYLNEAGGNWLDAIGRYNSHNEGPKHAYQLRFEANFARLFGLGGR